MRLTIFELQEHISAIKALLKEYEPLEPYSDEPEAEQKKNEEPSTEKHSSWLLNNKIRITGFDPEEVDDFDIDLDDAFEEHEESQSEPQEAVQASTITSLPFCGAASNLDDFDLNPDLTFQELLFQTMDRRGLDERDVYKTARIDRRLFSKIRSNKDYQPNKKTALTLALAMELTLDETTDLLSRAGYALSPSNAFDLILRYCLEHGIYELDDVNELLYKFDQPVLGC